MRTIDDDCDSFDTKSVVSQMEDDKWDDDNIADASYENPNRFIVINDDGIER